MDQPKWKLFEKDIHAIHAQFAEPGSTVTYDEKIVGINSQVERQIDVTIRTVISNFPLLIVIECKNRKRPIDVGEMSEFASRANDVRANKGVMISTSGYTAAALNIANTSGIDALVFNKTPVQSDGI
jgi:restriction endonuclease Mrr